jgi:hypothetical protein
LRVVVGVWVVIVSSPTPVRITELSIPPLETGEHRFAVGWLRTCAQVMLRPGPFFRRLGAGPVRKPLTFALLSIALPVLVAELGAIQQGDVESDSTPVAILKLFLIPPLAVAWVAYVQPYVWRRSVALFGSRAPRSIAVRAMLYLTAVAATLGLVMTIAGFAPESAPYVITWYAALLATQVYVLYALYSLAKGPYALPTASAIAAVALFELAYAAVLFAAALASFATSAALKP